MYVVCTLHECMKIYTKEHKCSRVLYTRLNVEYLWYDLQVASNKLMEKSHTGCHMNIDSFARSLQDSN